MKEEVRGKARRDDLLYDKFAKALEAEHHGEWDFAFRRIGFKALGRWRRCGRRSCSEN